MHLSNLFSKMYLLMTSNYKKSGFILRIMSDVKIRCVNILFNIIGKIIKKRYCRIQVIVYF